MKKHKMLITLAGLVAVVATSATITAYSLAGDGSSAPAGESAGTHEPAFQDDKPTLHGDPTIYDGKGNVSVTNPDVKVDDTPPLHGDPEPPKPVDGTAVPDIAPGSSGSMSGDVGPTDNSQDPGVPAGMTPLAPTDDVEDLDGQVVRVYPGTGLLIDPLLATGTEVKFTGEVVSEDPFQVDGRVLEVNGERVLVMDYGDAAALEAEAAGISPDGSSVGTHMVTWVGAHHFFRTDTAIVLYVGESPTVIEALTKVMGPQFAGR